MSPETTDEDVDRHTQTPIAAAVRELAGDDL